MSAKKKSGGRVTAKGTKPAEKTPPSAASTPASRAPKPNFDPIRARLQNTHTAPTRGHRGNR
jgi:hypothetical protein